jgi:tetratricopeptide (TPR) repeat protein
LPLQQAVDAGMYFLAMAARRQGRREEARAMLQQVAASGTPRFEARAIQALGTIEHEENRPDEALRLYIKAATIAGEADRSALINAQLQFSSIKSLAGDHQHALDDIETLWPLVQVVARDHPHVFFAYHNELAYELAQVGKLDVAQQVIQVAINSTLIDKYPEWQETGAEIQQQISRPLIIAVPTIGKPAQPSKAARLSFIFTNQLCHRAFTLQLTIKENQITCWFISEWVRLCTPIRAPTAIS